jgi:hypothetical protein
MPDGRHTLITIVRDDGGETAGLVDLKDGSVHDLGIRGHGFVYVAPGWLAFQQGTTLLAAAFDPDNPARAANPVPVIEKVLSAPRVARDGTLVYIPTRGESSARLVWVDRDGRPTPVGGERLDYTHLDLAPDGRRALLNLEGGQIDLIDLQSGTRKLVAKGGFPIWSANGERVTFTGGGGIQWAPADGSAAPQMLVFTAWVRDTDLMERGHGGPCLLRSSCLRNLDPLRRRKNAALSWRSREKTFGAVLTGWQMAGLRQ